MPVSCLTGHQALNTFLIRRKQNLSRNTPLPDRPQRSQRLAILQIASSAVMDAPAQKASLASGAHGRVFNFSAGPATLPVPVLEQTQADLINFRGSGMSVMEMSHRGPEFTRIIEEAEADLRQLMDIPDNYKVLFLQGGASQQFSAIPFNLTQPDDIVDHVVTGSWSKKAAEEAAKYCKVNIAAKGDNKSVPDRSTWQLTPGARYVHYCDNETIQGVEFSEAPEVGDTLLVADMSSNFCSKPVDVSKYALIYAGAQKNIGPAGVVVVIVREDLVGKARADTPVTLDYKVMEGSLYNTPPCWSIYVCGLVFKHLLAAGGLPGVKANNDAKAQLVYDAIQSSSGFFSSPVEASVRSNMNIPFTIPSDAALEKDFLQESSKKNMVQLKGHRSVGGMRASVYNSMPIEGAKALADFMKDFQSRH